MFVVAVILAIVVASVVVAVVVAVVAALVVVAVAVAVVAALVEVAVVVTVVVAGVTVTVAVTVAICGQGKQVHIPAVATRKALRCTDLGRRVTATLGRHSLRNRPAPRSLRERVLSAA